MSYGHLSQMLEYLTGAYARQDMRNDRHSLPLETNIGRLFGTLAWGLEIIHENADRLKLWDDIDNAVGDVLDRYGPTSALPVAVRTTPSTAFLSRSR